MRELSRRQVLGIGGALGLIAATGLSVSAALANRPPVTGRELRSAVPLPPAFQVPLPIPAVLAPAGTDRYEITQREASVEILPITVTHRNELPVPTAVHLHGGRTTPESDGARPTWSPRGVGSTVATPCTTHARWSRS